MRWAEQLVRMGEIRNAYKILVGNPEGRRPLGRSSYRLEDNVGKVWTGFILLRIGTVAGCCEHGNEPSGSIKGGEFLGSPYYFQKVTTSFGQPMRVLVHIIESRLFSLMMKVNIKQFASECLYLCHYFAPTYPVKKQILV
jgi:hypothetical protein